MRIAQITDPHLTVDGTPYQGVDNDARWTKALEKAAEIGVDHLLLSGDFCAREPRQEIYERVRPQLDALGIPYTVLTGNHDSRAMLRNYFELPGQDDEPIIQSRSLGGYEWLILDSCEHWVDQRQLDWLQAKLPECERPLVMIHHPPCLMGSAFMDKHYPLQNGHELMQLLWDDGRPIPVFCGHYHFSLLAQVGNVSVYCAPPTSFFIDPAEVEIKIIEHQACLQLIELREEQILVRVIEV